MEADNAKGSSSSNGLRQVFSRPNRSRTTLVEPEDSNKSGGSSRAQSFDDSRDAARPATSGGTEREGGHSGFSKLIPRRRNRNKQAETESIAEDPDAGLEELLSSRSGDSRMSLPSLEVNGQRRRSMTEPSGRSPMATDSESETHSAETGHKELSPAITISNAPHSEQFAAQPGSNPSERSSTASSENTLDRLKRPARRSTTLSAPQRKRSPSRSSTGRRLRDVFSSSSQRSTSPDRTSIKSTDSKKSTKSNKSAKSGKRFFKSSRKGSLSSKKSPKISEEPPPVPTPPPFIAPATPGKRVPSEQPPRTPPISTAFPPMATVTPPTPTNGDSRIDQSPLVDSPVSMRSIPSLPPNAVISPSGNMISHRRVRSASAAHPPSKLSNSMVAPSTPTIEEGQSSSARNSTGNQVAGGFFSTMFSAAQNAASTLSSSFNPPSQSRVRSLTEPADLEKKATLESTESIAESNSGHSSDEKKELAVDTLGMGSLDFSHLGIDAAAGGVIKTKDGVVFTKMDNAGNEASVSRRDELAARMEELKAARAVSMAYEKRPDGSGTNVVEDTLSEPRPSAPISGLGKDSTGERTPPAGSMFDGDTGDNFIKRSASLRSRRRRHRGSSGATGTTLGAIGAVVGNLALPGVSAPPPRLTGFAVASKKRNRDFHQLFRSVPEDDYLIEDYSCALQREIILAGRIYISEGHICFSSNILGWVTTLVIGFDEVIAIEKESTAMVFPNAIAIQTLHARHTFRSLLSRESTYDLMVNIWKQNHPSLKSSVNGTRVEQGTGDKTEKAEESEAESGSGSEAEDDEVYDEDEEGHEDGLDGSIVSGDSIQPLSQKSSTMPLATAGTPQLGVSASNGESKSRAKAASSAGGDFPGPKIHAPTEYTDPAGYYDKLVKDEVIPAPLGQVYSLVFGPASGAFMTKFLLENQKATDLQFDDDKKGLTNDTRTRTYSYTKPLNASIGPRQTKCISTENLDFMDLEKAVLVTLTTQTPDVPSGNVFSVKTKYLFTWAPGNATRFYMSCTIEWTGKSWIKGPIEKGANDGQASFGVDLVNALRQGVAPRARHAKAGKGKGKRRRTVTAQADANTADNAAAKATRQNTDWGLFEPLRRPLSPIVDIFQPFLSSNIVFGTLFMMILMMWLRTPSQTSVGYPGIGYHGPSLTERMIAYEELWRREESELWNWLDERVGFDGLVFKDAVSDHNDGQARLRPQHRRSKSEKDLDARIRDEKMTEREVEDAIRVTHERLGTLQRVFERRKRQQQADD